MIRLIKFTIFFYLAFALWQWKFNPQDWGVWARSWSVGLLIGSIALDVIADVWLEYVRIKTEKSRPPKSPKLEGYIERQLREANEARKAALAKQRTP